MEGWTNNAPVAREKAQKAKHSYGKLLVQISNTNTQKSFEITFMKKERNNNGN